jgi:hypothetical protein
LLSYFPPLRVLAELETVLWIATGASSGVVIDAALDRGDEAELRHLLATIRATTP